MNRNYAIPALRDLPPGRLDERREHLLAIVGSDPQKARPLPLSTGLRAHRRLVVVLAAVVILGALISAPALGLQGAIRDLFGRSDVSFDEARPAPSVIKRDFADMVSGAPKGMNPKVIAGQTKLAAIFGSGSAERRVWVAPTMEGGFCYVIERASGGCRSSDSARQPLELDGGFVLRAGASEPVMDLVAGKVFSARATTLRVTFEDGSTIAVPFVYVSAPIDAGFFAYEPTVEQQRPGHRPASIVLRDAHGEKLGGTDIDWQNEKRKAEQIRKIYQERARSRPGG